MAKMIDNTEKTGVGLPSDSGGAKWGFSSPQRSPYVAPEKNNQAAKPPKVTRPVLSAHRVKKTKSRLDEDLGGSFSFDPNDEGPKFPGAGEGPTPMY